MSRQQRITGSIIVVGLGTFFGRFRLFGYLKSNPKELHTNLQPVDAPSSTFSGTSTASISSGEQDDAPSALGGSSSISGEQETPASITILLPPRFHALQRAQLSNQIQHDTAIIAKPFQPKSLAAYLKALTILTTGERQVDIMLIPRNEHEHLIDRGAHISRKNSPAPFLYPQLASLLEDRHITFFPYAIDPWVTALRQPLSSSHLTLAKLLQQITLARNVFPLGISSDRSVSTEPRTRFFRILSMRLDQTATVDSPETLALLLRPQSIPPLTCFDRFSCLQASSDLYALRLPLSQAEEEAIDSSQRGIAPFPSLTERYPADVRGRVINKRSSHLTASTQRVEGYLRLLIQDQLPYHDRMLPVLQSRFQRTLLQPQWQWLAPIAYRFQRLTVSTSAIGKRMQYMPVKDLIDGTYNPAIFLQQRITASTDQ